MTTSGDMPADPAPTPLRATESPHSVPAAAVVASIEADADWGLAEGETAARLSRHGPNELAEAPPPPLWRKFVAQLTETVVLILLAAVLRDRRVG